MIRLQRLIDRYLGTLLCYVLYPLSRSDKTSKYKRILIIKLWALGDSILVLPMIDALKKKYPKSKIDVMARRNKAVFENNKDIDRLISPNDSFKNLRKYDLVVDTEPYLNLSSIIAFFLGRRRVGFSHGIRSMLYTDKVTAKDQHMVQNYLDMIRKIGIKYNTTKLIPLETSKQEQIKSDRFLKQHKPKILIGICPGVAESVKSRMWPIPRVIELCNRLLEDKDVQIIINDGPNNKEIVEEIIKSVKEKNRIHNGLQFSLRESFYLIKKCDVFISNDTGPMHIAAAQGVPTIGLFGPNTPKLWGPYGKNNISIYKPKGCKPTIDNFKAKFEDCWGVMENITVDEVYQAVMKKLR